MVVAEWDAKTVWTVTITVGGIAIAALTPWFANYILWLFEKKAPERFARVVFAVLEADENSPRLQRRFEQLFDRRRSEVDRNVEEALTLSIANRDAIRAMEESVKMHGAQMMEMRALVKDVPTLVPTLQRVSMTMERMGERMEEMGVAMARMDERQKLIIERRGRQEPNSPHRRWNDDPRD